MLYAISDKLWPILAAISCISHVEQVPICLHYLCTWNVEKLLQKIH